MKIKALLIFSFLMFGAAQFSYAQIICGVNAGPGATICPGETVSLNATVTPDTLNYRYFWSPSAGLSDTSIINPTATPDVTTTYSIEVTTVDSTELVVNGNFSNGYVGFTSDYRDSISLWNEGTYSINTSPQNVHPGFFGCGDHTTGNTQFMIINGTAVANAVVWSQTINVTPFTDYEFSAWLTNVLNNAPTLPLLQFSINGQLLGPPFTSAQTACEWTQFFTTWYSDTSTTAVIEIINQSTFNNGNDFGIDDISFRGICRSVDSLTIVVHEPYDPAIYGLGADTMICDSNPLTLETAVPGASMHMWQDGSTDPNIIVTTQGTYYVDLLDGNGCAFTDTISVTESSSPQITLPADTTICEDNVVVFNVYDPTATSYLWKGPSVYFLQNNPRDSVFTATFAGTYEVDISNECGTLTQIIDLKTEDCVCSPFVPNSFTPNNDGNNDDLYIYAGCEISNIKFSVFNRWGARVFYTDDINVGWDGKVDGTDAPMGVYVYKFEYTAANFKGEVVAGFTYGDITLVR